MVDGTYVNNPYLNYESRHPRGIVKINDIPVPFIECEVEQTNYYLASSFRIDLPVSALPPSLPLSYFFSTPAIMIKIYAGFPLNPDSFSDTELDLLMLGRVDDFDIFMERNTITISGRDLTSKFIAAKTTEKFQNHTSSEIAEILATRQGLKSNITPTSTTVGKYYQIDHVRLNDQSSEWDLLTFLAKEEGYNVYVKGDTLYFNPFPTEQSKPYLIYFSNNDGKFKSNAITLNIHRNYTISKDIIVKVISWNMKSKKKVEVTVKATHNKNTVLAGAAQPIGDAQVFSYRFANLTKQQALSKAQQLLHDASLHEMNLRSSLPGDDILSNQVLIKVSETNTNADQVYYPSHIIRTINMDAYSMSVEAKNHQPNSEVVL